MSSYCFPMMRVPEIIAFFHENNVQIISDSDFKKPEPFRWGRIYEIIIELLSNISPDSIYQKCNEPSMVKSELLEYPEMHKDSLTIAALFLSMRRTMSTCGVTDFNLEDIIEPTNKRLQKICSAAINLIKFRSKRLKVFEKHKEENKKYKDDYDKLKMAINKKEEEFAREEPERKRIENELSTLTNQMDAMNKESEVFRSSIQELKTDMTTKKSAVGQLKLDIALKEKEIETLSQKIVQSPEKVVNELERKEEKLETLKSTIIDKRNQRADWSNQSEKFNFRESTAEKLVQNLQSYRQEKMKENEISKEMSQNAEQYQELQTNLDASKSKLSQLANRQTMRKEAINKLEQQYQSKMNELSEQLTEYRKDKQVYKDKKNTEADQKGEILKETETIVDNIEKREREVEERLSNISNMYSQLILKNNEANANFEEEWNDFLQVFNQPLPKFDL